MRLQHRLRHVNVNTRLGASLPKSSGMPRNCNDIALYATWQQRAATRIREHDTVMC